jgi:hypothetical protein
MTSKASSKGNKATHSDKLGGPDCEPVAMTTSGNSARLGRSVAHSPLFKLSAELRNTIYRLALVEDHDDFCVEPVVVDDVNGIPEPGLLLSNKVVRSEALGIFYYENDWNCEVRNFDPAPVLLLQSKFKMPFSEHPMFITITSVRREANRKTWRNLVSWLHMCHKGKCPSLFYGVDCHDQFGRDQRAEMALLDGLFETAENCPEVSSKNFDRMIASMEMAWEHCAWLSW